MLYFFVMKKKKLQIIEIFNHLSIIYTIHLVCFFLFSYSSFTNFNLQNGSYLAEKDANLFDWNITNV